MEKQRLQRKIEELEKKWNRLSEVLDKLDHERILETKPEEKIRLEHKIAQIKAERQQVEEQLNELEDELSSKKEDVSATPTEGAETIRRRSEPLSVSEENVQKVFGLDKERRPCKYIKNDYEDRGDIVVDHTTGLMWQKSGSEKLLKYEEAQAYIDKLNCQRFAGYMDWRLLTIEELMSLLEPEIQSNGLYTNPIFGAKQCQCWSADKVSLPPLSGIFRLISAAAWSVYFDDGYVSNCVPNSKYVRAVRS